MIVETSLDFDWTSVMIKRSKLPRQQEWENVVSLMQGADKGAISVDKWHLIERFFHL
jgi:hypothetical protein